MTIDFAAIDFETANEFRGSPCAIGLALVRNGKIVEEHRLLMRPPQSSGPDDFASFNVDLHGISWEMVKNEPEFLDIWNSLTPIIGDLPLVAHNAAFDIGVLRDALEMSGVLWPSLSYTCTLITSRRILSLPSYSLRYVAAELKLDLGKHHDALDDARTSARIMLELCGRTSQKSLDSFLQSVSVGWGKLSEGHWQGSTVQQSRSRHRSRRELPEPRSDASPDHFPIGKHVVLPGTLSSGIVRSPAFTEPPADFVIEHAWALAEAICPPPPIDVPQQSRIAPIPKPLPPNVLGKGTVNAARFLIIVIAIAVICVIPRYWWLVVVVAWMGLGVAGDVGASDRCAERTRRTATLNLARSNLDALMDRAKREVGTWDFQFQKRELKELRDEFQALPVNEKNELEQLQRTVRVRQIKKYLETFLIDTAAIPGVGPARRATLRSLGIETAADVSSHSIGQIGSFGPNLTLAMTDWRAKCERSIVFDPALGVTEAEKQAVRNKFRTQRASLARSFRSSAAKLQRISQAGRSSAASLHPQILDAAKQLAQAEIDLSLL